MTIIKPDDEFADFVAHRSAALLRTAYLLCGGDRGAAEDLLQDVLERVYVKRRRVRGELEPYVRAAPANASANRWRHRSRRVPESPLHISPNLSIGEDGKTTRTWSEMSDLGGIWFAALPEQARGPDVRVVRGVQPATANHSRSVTVLPASLYTEGADRQSKPIPSARWTGRGTSRSARTDRDRPR